MLEFTLLEVQEMIKDNNETRKENLRVQSLTTNEFILNTLKEHYHVLLNETAELRTMQENHPDFVLAVW